MQVSKWVYNSAEAKKSFKKWEELSESEEWKNSLPVLLDAAGIMMMDDMDMGQKVLHFARKKPMNHFSGIRPERMNNNKQVSKWIYNQEKFIEDLKQRIIKSELISQLRSFVKFTDRDQWKNTSIFSNEALEMFEMINECYKPPMFEVFSAHYRMLRSVNKTNRNHE